MENGKLLINIEKVLTWSGMSIEEIAANTGVNQTLLEGLRNDPGRSITTHTLEKLLNGLLCDITDVLEYQPPQGASKKAKEAVSQKTAYFQGLGDVTFDFQIQEVRKVKASLDEDRSTKWFNSEKRALAALRTSYGNLEEIPVKLFEGTSDETSVILEVRGYSNGWRARWSDSYWVPWRHHKPEVFQEDRFSTVPTKEEAIAACKEKLESVIPYLDKEVTLKMKRAKMKAS